jgi:hypothetical protein
MSAIAPTAPPKSIPADLLRPSPVRMEQVSVSHSLAVVAPAIWAKLTPEERRLLRHVRLIVGGTLANLPRPPQAFVSPVAVRSAERTRLHRQPGR